jgi:dGTPase
MRTETEKDRGRVSYSPFLRRLSGVTQVVSPNLDTPRLHSRESHSQKVALVSREIAEHITRRAAGDHDWAEIIHAFGGLDVSATETAGLAHDLGHPPFGHVGEVVLNELLRGRNVEDGFEGNAQTFRIVTRLDSRKLDAPKAGLNLTAVTLAAILKYPYLCSEEKLITGANAREVESTPPKFGAYRSDSEQFERVIGAVASGIRGSRQSLEASIMDLADDITYAIHDLEDFYQEDAIDFGQVIGDLNDAAVYLAENASENVSASNRNPFIDASRKLNRDFPGYFDKSIYSEKLEVAVRILETGGFQARYRGGRLQGNRLQSKMAVEIANFFDAIRVSTNPPWPNGPSVHLEAQAWHLMQCLKTITRRYVIDTPKIGLIQRAQRSVVTELFGGLCDWAESEPLYAELPQPLADYLASAGKTGHRVPAELTPEHYRAIADYICSLSDQECYLRSNWIRGIEVPGLALAH